jgi:chaperonin GroES
MADISLNQLHPTAGYVLVEPAKQPKKTQSGIYLPETSDEKPQHGKVLAVGDAIYEDGREVVSPVKKGDQVMYKKWGGNDVKIGDTEYQFLKFDDILAVIK